MESNLERKIEFENEEEKIKKIIADLYDRNMVVFQNAIVEKAEELRSKYPDYEDYLFYHILAGSTPEHKLDKMDFEGEDSIESFLKVQIQTLPPKNK